MSDQTRLIDYCGEKIREAQIALGEVRDVQRAMMHNGEDCSAVTAQTIGLRERIATYADVSEKARLGEF